MVGWDWTIVGWGRTMIMDRDRTMVGWDRTVMGWSRTMIMG